jgi:hypothetical protein
MAEKVYCRIVIRAKWGDHSGIKLCFHVTENPLCHVAPFTCEVRAWP